MEAIEGNQKAKQAKQANESNSGEAGFSRPCYLLRGGVPEFPTGTPTFSNNSPLQGMSAVSRGDDGGVPLCIFGPGGDFVRPYTPKCSDLFLRIRKAMRWLAVKSGLKFAGTESPDSAPHAESCNQAAAKGQADIQASPSTF